MYVCVLKSNNGVISTKFFKIINSKYTVNIYSLSNFSCNAYLFSTSLYTNVIIYTKKLFREKLFPNFLNHFSIFWKLGSLNK